MDVLDFDDALREITRLKNVLSWVLQTACDADEEDPKVLLSQIAEKCSDVL